MSQKKEEIVARNQEMRSQLNQPIAFLPQGFQLPAMWELQRIHSKFARRKYSRSNFEYEAIARRIMQHFPAEVRIGGSNGHHAILMADWTLTHPNRLAGGPLCGTRERAIEPEGMKPSSYVRCYTCLKNALELQQRLLGGEIVRSRSPIGAIVPPQKGD